MFNEPTQMSWRPAGSVAVIDLIGDVTHATEGALYALYAQVTASGFRSVLLHFHASPYITSGGIALVLRLVAHALPTDHQLGLTGLTAHFARMFRMAGLEAYAPIFESEPAALQAFAAMGDHTSAA